MASYRFYAKIDKEKIWKYFSNYEEGLKWQKDILKSKQYVLKDGEILKEIKGYSRYLASNFGYIISKNYKNAGYSKIIIPSTRDGYSQSMFLNDKNKYNTRKIHYLITLAFFGQRDDGFEVNHKNGIKTDNRIENLEYISHSDNLKHAFDNGLCIPKRGELNGMSKLTKEQVAFLRHRKQVGGMYWGRREYARQFGVSEKHIQRIVNKTDSWQ